MPLGDSYQDCLYSEYRSRCGKRNVKSAYGRAMVCRHGEMQRVARTQSGSMIVGELSSGFEMAA